MPGRAISHVSLWTAVIVTCLALPRARAEPELTLSWPNVSGCPDATHVTQRVVEQLARPLREVQRGLHASATIVEGDGAYRLTLRTEHEETRGERTLTATGCSELSEAASLVLALSLGALAEQAAEAAAVEQVPASTRRVGFRLRAAGLAELGFLPRIGAGMELGAAIAFGRSRLEIAGLWLPPVRSERTDDGARVSVSLWTARVGYCHDLVGRRTRLLGCAGVELGQAFGRGLSLADTFDRHFRWSAAQLALRLESQLAQRLGLYLEPSLALPFERRRFVSSDADLERSAVLHEPAPVSARLSIGVQAAF